MYVGKVVERVGKHLGLTISLETPELQEYIPRLILYQQKILDDSLMSRKTLLQRQLPLPEHIYDKEEAISVEYSDGYQVVRLYALEIRIGRWINAIEYVPQKKLVGKGLSKPTITVLSESGEAYRTKQIAFQKAAEAALCCIRKIERKKEFRSAAARKIFLNAKLWLQEQGKQLDLFDSVL